MFALQKPKNLSEFIGQKHLLGENAPIRKMIDSKDLIHLFFFGPPGCGKTSLARIISNEIGGEFFEFNATSLKIDDLRKCVANGKDCLNKPLIFIDEIHRLNKAQQEVLLPFMENFSAIFIGASTQNPYFALTSAIRSRSLIFEFHALSHDELNEILDSRLKAHDLTIENDAREYLLDSCNGDARAMLNLLHIAMQGEKSPSLKSLRAIKPNSEGVGESTTHYELISAMIKSIRGSDENASIYYLARLINAGESVEFIARRLVILASEDIGNANPNALNLANSTMQSVAKIGMPESRIILAQCVLYLSASPKSNTAYKAIDSALEFVKANPSPKIPEHIKPFSKNYRYPHDRHNSTSGAFGRFVEQEYLPKGVNARFVEFSDIGFEKTLKEWLAKIKGKK
ncbi:replication-associated recombination protein A [Helicobacter sp. 23-1044]